MRIATKQCQSIKTLKTSNRLPAKLRWPFAITSEWSKTLFHAVCPRCLRHSKRTFLPPGVFKRHHNRLNVLDATNQHCANIGHMRRVQLADMFQIRLSSSALVVWQRFVAQQALELIACTVFCRTIDSRASCGNVLCNEKTGYWGKRKSDPMVQALQVCGGTTDSYRVLR